MIPKGTKLEFLASVADESISRSLYSHSDYGRINVVVINLSTQPKVLFRVTTFVNSRMTSEYTVDEDFDTLKAAAASFFDGHLTGIAAIRYADSHGLTLSTHTDPTQEARDGVSVTEAYAIAREDPSLVYLNRFAPQPKKGRKK